MVKIKSDTPIVDAAGEPVSNGEGQTLTVGMALSQIMMSTNVGGAAKHYILGTKFFQQKAVELDEADFGLVKRAIQGTQIYGQSSLVPGQLEIFLDALTQKK